MVEKIVIIGPASQGLAFRVAELLKATPIATESKVFPDGETYIRIDIEDETILRGKDVIIVQTTGPNAAGNQNQRLMELLMIISAVKRIGPKTLRVVAPYLAYSRQDKAFLKGECIFAEEVCKMIQSAGATEFYAIELHNPDILKVFSIPAYNLDPMEGLSRELKAMHIPDPVVVSPDKGALQRSQDFARYLGDKVPVAVFSKERDKKTGEITMEGDLKLMNKDVIIVDDIIATGGTMAKAIEICKKSGANSIYAIGIHSLLLKNAFFILKKAGTTKIIGTDTIETAAFQISMADVIVNAIKANEKVK